MKIFVDKEPLDINKVKIVDDKNKVCYSGLLFSKRIIESENKDTSTYRSMTDEEYQEYENYMDGLAGDWEG